MPCWYAGAGDTAYVVGGDGEQPLPPLPPELRIILRDKETQRAIGPVSARATRIEPDSPAWDEATTALLAARQNNPPGGLREHWAEHCTVWSIEVTPRSSPLPPGSDPSPTPEQGPAAGHAGPAQPEPTTPD